MYTHKTPAQSKKSVYRTQLSGLESKFNLTNRTTLFQSIWLFSRKVILAQSPPLHVLENYSDSYTHLG